jgi:hypothetical protein
MYRMYLQLHFLAKKVEVNGYAIAALIIIALSCALRLFFIAHNWPLTDSDEGTIGLMALHIAHFKDFPIYLYGQRGTLGALEAYVGALLFLIFGPTAFALRIGMLLLFVPFLIGMYWLTSLLYTRKLALLTLVLLSLGSDEILLREYGAFAGHGETPLFGALIVLVATMLALSSATRGGIWRRRLGYGLWSFLVGIAIWNDPLAGPFVLTSGIFLFIFCRHELRRSILLSILIGLLIGLLPMLIYNFSVPFDQSSFAVYGFLVDYSHPVVSDSLFERFTASFLVTLPVSTGATTFCAMTQQSAWPLSAQMWPCIAIHGAWALALIIFWLLGVILAVLALRPLGSMIPFDADSPEKRRGAILQGARLMLLGSALLGFLIYTLSVQAITDPWSNQRYLIALGVATPALLWPLWQAFGSIRFSGRLVALSVKILCAALLGCYVITMGAGTVAAAKQIPQVESRTLANDALAPALLRLHITHIYTDYWTCDLTAFLSQERVTCSVLDTHLRPGVNRYTPYVGIVAQDPQAAYVFQVDSAQAKLLAERAADKAADLHFHVTYVDGYVVYQPIVDVGVLPN